jgi:hypothetical protein
MSVEISIQGTKVNAICVTVKCPDIVCPLYAEVQSGIALRCSPAPVREVQGCRQFNIPLCRGRSALLITSCQEGEILRPYNGYISCRRSLYRDGGSKFHVNARIGEFFALELGLLKAEEAGIRRRGHARRVAGLGRDLGQIHSDDVRVVR